MAIINKPNNLPLDPNGVLGVPAWMVPSFRIVMAAEKGAQMNILIKAHGGVGDVICSEPAIRYAVEHFKSSKVSLLSPYPELFRHLKFHEVYANPHDSVCNIDLNQFLMYQTIDVTNELGNEFVCHALMSGVDYAALNMWRLVLPNHLKRVILTPTDEEYAKAAALSQPNDVVVHAGRTWKSRTFPKHYWDAILAGLVKGGARPVLIGGVIDKGRATTVDVNTEGCLDLRHQQTLMETVACLHSSKVLLSNDSSPVHMAATGNAWIGFFSTVKHPDHLTHWRRAQRTLPNCPVLPRGQEMSEHKDAFGWRMQDLGLGGLYKELEFAPNLPRSVNVDQVEITQLLKWLPDSEEVVKWALDKLNMG